MNARMVPMNALYPNPDNPPSRLRGIEDLAESIKLYGVLQPLIVTPRQRGGLTIIDGRRRYAAADLAGRQAVPCVAAKAATRTDQLLLILAAGLGERLTPLEEAQVMGDLRAAGVKFTDIARRTGRSLSTVRERLQLLHTPSEVQDMVAAGTLTATAAAQLARQTATTGSGTVATRAPARPAWFTKSHPMARLVRETCTHRDTRKVVGGVGCGQCWQDVIVADARGEVRA
ncbi:ParB/RepB/Spo0J family partition protein [Cellulomonas hominis]|uniref:ParB/RepB/Spo0J family partition protein n=1 Tax=Cellulomonas hominis TaxID=156981 RepID=UPI001990783A|nr:ParB/RepB/Spo0J family partition protein [Cellulomonas hominis]MBD3780200.1 ParB/RepB/Spo0J family partition protein [Micrococcales bacterium]MBU5421149.1 ParB/RepB/Spo0J family partition protein [Cellulomonas hominis]